MRPEATASATYVNNFVPRWMRDVRLLGVTLRLPLLFLMDTILLNDMGAKFPFYAWAVGGGHHHGVGTRLVMDGGDRRRIEPLPAADTVAVGNPGNNSSPLDEYERLYGNPDWILMPHVTYFLIWLNIYLACGFCVTLLNTYQLLTFYKALFTFAAVPISYLANLWMLQSFLDNSRLAVLALMCYCLSQVLIAYVVSALAASSHLNNNGEDNILADDHLITLRQQLAYFLVIPVSLSVAAGGAASFGVIGHCDSSFLHSIALVSTLPVLLCVLSRLWRTLCGMWTSLSVCVQEKKEFLHNFGLNVLLEREWQRLQMPLLLRTFWATRVAQQLIMLFFESSAATTVNESRFASLSTLLWDLLRSVLTRGNETLIAILGMTSVVAAVCHQFGALFRFLLTPNNLPPSGGGENAEEKSVASVSAILFFVLALQTGLTSLEPEKRFSRLCKNLCLLLTALFHIVHNMANPVLMSLSAARDFRFHKHFRALSVCAFLVTANFFLLTVLWRTFPVGTWLLAVTAFCVEVVVKVAVTVIVYALLLYDLKIREGAWEGLDDAVYYVRGAGNCVEFGFAVFLFFNGGWILFFESSGTIRAMMMLMHAYCNIWCEARSGWETFRKRRTAVYKINCLPDATRLQLLERNDVCAICYQEMESAKVTLCGHLFHGGCLRKWLHVQETCPLCHSILYKTEKKVDDIMDNNRSAGGGEEGDNTLEQDVIDNDVVNEETDSDVNTSSSPSSLSEEFSDDLSIEHGVVSSDINSISFNSSRLPRSSCLINDFNTEDYDSSSEEEALDFDKSR